MKDRQPRTTRGNLETAARVTIAVSLGFAGSMALRQDVKGEAHYQSAPFVGHFIPVEHLGTARPQIRISDRNIIAERKKDGPGVTEPIGVFPSSSVTPSPESSLSPEEQKVQDLKEQANYYLKLAKESGKFNADSLDALHDNLPFYLAAGKKYKIDWIVLWVIQRRESGASDPNSAAFNSANANKPVQGSWQINVGWGEDFANEKKKKLEYTEAFPERHKGDRVGASEAANMIRRNLDQYKAQGYETALLKAMSIYCGFAKPPEREIGGEDEVNRRLDMISDADAIFSDQIKKDGQGGG